MLFVIETEEGKSFTHEFVTYASLRRALRLVNATQVMNLSVRKDNIEETWVAAQDIMENRIPESWGAR